MSLSQLSYFIAVAEEQHLTRAAHRQHISQPPLTRKIEALEYELGGPLFERYFSGMKLLPRGERLLSEERQILEMVQNLRSTIAVSKSQGPPPTIR